MTEQPLADAVVDFIETWLPDVKLTGWQRHLIRQAYAEPLRPLGVPYGARAAGRRLALLFYQAAGRP
jgi:hypothetical protein